MAGKPTFGSYIRNARKQQGLRIKDIAMRLDVSYAAVYRWELDSRRPSPANLAGLCEMLKLPIEEMREMAADPV
jgi:transcriptional regulator with XRE-family HTH domain